MAQDKKTEELEYLQYFLSSDEGKKWRQQNKILSYKDGEAPDFTFVTEDNQKIGLEITKFIVKSQHGKALQHLMSIGNQVYQYTKKHHGLNISIIITKCDRQAEQARTYRDMLDAACNPGFGDIYDKQLIKSGIEHIIDRNVEKLKQWPCFVKESICVQNEYFNISISGFENIDGKFDCQVNNECFSKENPFDELQEEINKKNQKFDSYLKNCDKCFLLIYLPDVSHGNYCYFTKKLNKHKFCSKFEDTYICQWNKIFPQNNFVKKLCY